MSGVAITDIGAEVYSTDDQTVTTSSAGSATKVGRIMDFETNIAWVDIGGYC
jgi:predicted RecA/RadA family phage recombinase